MIKLMVEEFIDIKMELHTTDTGRMICSMARGLRNGLMGVCIKENTLKERNMVMDFINGQTDLHMKVSGSRIRFQVLAFILGWMAVDMMGNGKTTTWKV